MTNHTASSSNSSSVYLVSPKGRRRLCKGALKSVFLLLGLMLLVSAETASADKRIKSVDLKYELVKIASGLRLPVAIVPFPDGSGRKAIVEQEGYIKVMQSDNKVRRARFLTVKDVIDARSLKVTGNEAGLLGIAFHPNFATNRKFYIYYTDPDQTIHVSELKTNEQNPNKSDPSSERTLLKIKHPTYFNHFGGQMLFGPDGYLYIGVADGGGVGDPQNSAKNLKDLRGKILRIDVDGTQGHLPYRIPTDNPFVGNSHARHEIYAYGFRNPWRFHIDLVTGWMLESDVGQFLVEDVNLVTPGGNYGWNTMEGKHCFNRRRPLAPNDSCDKTGINLPVYYYTRPQPFTFASTAIIGAGIYRGTQLPDLAGKYIFADLTHGFIKTLSPLNDQGTKWQSASLFEKVPFLITSFGTEVDGELFVLAYDKGEVYKLVAIS